MTRLLLTAFLAITFSATACVVRVPPPHAHGHSKRAVSRAAPKCKPSHHWDGKKCRRNGKGKGARKHDYVP